MAERQVGAHLGDVAREVVGEHRVDEDDLGAGVGEDELQLFPRQAQVQGVDDACPEEPCVIQLEELVPVARHDPEPIVRLETELSAHGVVETEHTVRVRLEGRVIDAVVEAHLR